jgi:hypothetical protein
MTIPVSTVPAAISALLAQTQTQVANDSDAGTILLIEGQEGDDRPDDIIIIGTNIHRTVTWEAFIGTADLDALGEVYEIESMVSCWSGDSDPVAIKVRAWQLVGYIETGVRTDPSLGGLVVVAQPAGTSGGGVVWSEAVGSAPIGRLCEITVTVRVTTLN